jgi:hypothetical protein
MIQVEFQERPGELDDRSSIPGNGRYLFFLTIVTRQTVHFPQPFLQAESRFVSVDVARFGQELATHVKLSPKDAWSRDSRRFKTQHKKVT